MDYCRVDFYRGDYIYCKNDTLTEFGEYRSSYVLRTNGKPLFYQRIKRMKAIPKGKKVNVIYHKSTQE